MNKLVAGLIPTTLKTVSTRGAQMKFLIFFALSVLASNSYASYTCVGLDDNNAGVIVDPGSEPIIIGKLNGQNVAIVQRDDMVALAVGGISAFAQSNAMLIGQYNLKNNRSVTCKNSYQPLRIITISPNQPD